MANIYLQDMYGRPLGVCHNGALIRILKREGKTKLISAKPYTVRLLVPVRNEYTQSYTLGVNSGYRYVGISAVNEAGEAFSAELDMDPEAGKTNKNSTSERIKEKRTYRRTRRNRLRYRKPRFNNRRKPVGWIPPSLQRKVDTTVRMVERIMGMLPVNRIVVEAGKFDPALLKSEAEGVAVSYQHGEQKGFESVKQYVMARDNYTCQNPKCPCKKLPDAEKRKLRLRVHHLGYLENDRSNRPSNLVTLCERCHTPRNHQPGGDLYGWKPKLKSLKEATYMNLVRYYIIPALADRHPDTSVGVTYGYITSVTRRDRGIDKSHHDDAFAIANVDTNKRADVVYYYKQHRRNNRSLETFTDAKYIDSRDGKAKTGMQLSSGRTSRKIDPNVPNLRQYRQQKTHKGIRSIRRAHYKYQPNDLIRYDGKTCRVSGTHCKGKRVVLHDGSKSVSRAVTKVSLYRYNRGVYLAEAISTA